MPIVNFVCAGCRKPLNIDAQFAGRFGRCPQCGITFTVPTPGPVGAEWLTPEPPPIPVAQTKQADRSFELEVTWERAIRIWWSFFWRSLFAVVVAMLMAGAAGFFCGVVLGAMGYSSDAVQKVVYPFGFFFGLTVTLAPIKMILGKDFGDFRLVLLAKQIPEPRQVGHRGFLAQIETHWLALALLGVLSLASLLYVLFPS
jgi:hypothetical protein